MKFLLYAIAYIFFCGSLLAYDPFEGFLTVDCFKCRKITGCNETMLDAYKRTEASKSDQNINEAETRIYLFTCLNEKEPECLHECGGRLPTNTNYNPKKKTIIIVGGYISSVCTMAFFQEYKIQLLCRDCYNVILIDWIWGNGVDYYSASRNTKVVGKQIAFVINNIMEHFGVGCNGVHIIGHSLGAHIAGFAGSYCKCKIWRITGLDPAGVNFIEEDSSGRLDSSDAQNVDIIHSNAGPCFPLALGYPVNMGHADFYPNGGSKQLSCYPTIVTSMLKFDFYYAFVLLLGPFCPHFQSVQYFKESINACNCQFVGVKCESYEAFKCGSCRSCGEDGSNCAVMGMDWERYPPKNKNATTNASSYYLKTNLLCPYCNNKCINLQGFPTESDEGTHCFCPRNNTCS